MTKLEEIERDIRQLSLAELAAFRSWFYEFDADEWDREIEQDVKAGKFDTLVQEALAEHKKLSNIIPVYDSMQDVAERNNEILRLLAKGVREIELGEGYDLNAVLADADLFLSHETSCNHI